MLSVQTGRSRVVGGADPYTTAYFKTPVAGRVSLGAEGLAGDEQADRAVHGGPENAVCVYSADHHPSWREELGRALSPGDFGENFTVAGLDEGEVAVGDVFEVGGAVVEVSQPRGPCWKMARAFGLPELPKRVLATNRTGWYFRVLGEGVVGAGDALARVERRAPEWTIARVNQVTYFPDPVRGIREMAELAACERLARGWRLSLERKVANANAAAAAPSP